MREEWYYENRVVVRPEPKRFRPPPVSDGVGFMEGLQHLQPERSINIRRDYAERGLQVTAKLANIHLTPEKPKYEGGTLHVEGQLNGHICASVIYYYDNENIITSRLAFCQQSDTELDYFDISEEEPGYGFWLESVFVCERYQSGVQYIGAVDTPEGRLTWPNILQHQVKPFELADSTHTGHRKILALFLVDPNIRIISTANVPCQRRDWWSDAVRRAEGAFPALPVELQDRIFEAVEEFPISPEEATEL